MSGKSKTSFKTLLSKSGSNPTVSLQSVRAQRDKLQRLKQSSAPPPSKVARTQHYTASAAAPVKQNLEQVPTSGTGAGGDAFIPCPTFAGVRQGFAFKAGPLGLGYYADGVSSGGSSSGATGTLQHSVEAAGEEAGGDESASSSALPLGFFDNPQLDPANRGREVAKTKKEQTLNEAMDEFNKIVSSDLQAADDADEVDEEDEEEFKLREAVSVARELELKIASLKRQRLAAEASKAATVGGAPPGGIAAAASDEKIGEGDEGESDDDDDDDEGVLDVLDWRAKQLH
jgi:hypothetical protein